MLPALRSYRIPGLNLGDDLVYPQYTGRSILNIPSTICRILGVPELGTEPLSAEILSAIGSGYRRVLLIVMDALSLQRFQRWLAEGRLPSWERLIRDGLLMPLTSITPSTTAAALTTLWTGRSAAGHGITGFEMWLKEYGIVANMIAHRPITYSGGGGSLINAGFNSQAFIPGPPLGTHLAAHQIPTFVFQHYAIMNSGLSQMFFRDVELQSFSTATDLWINAREVLERRAGEPLYAYVYWSEVDTFSHRYGPDTDYPAAEMASFGAALESLFLSRLSPAARQGTLMLLIADHGQITTRRDPHYELSSHPGLLRRLHIFPTGENRLVYFYIRPGQTEAVHEYIQRTWPQQFSLVDPQYAADSGLFGPGERHPQLLERLGDLIAVAHGDAYLWWSGKENHMVGRHGGLHPEEMLVPLFAMPLT